MNEYDEYDNEEDSYIGYNRFLLQQLKSNQHAEKNNSLSWHQTQHSLPCSYQTLNYSANNSWKPQTRHFASFPLSPEEIISKKKYSSSKFIQHQLFSILFYSFRGFIVKQRFIIFIPTYPTPVEECSAKKILRKGRKGIAAEKNWAREEIETLITLWGSNEILYNVSFHLSKDKKSAAVKQITEQWETNEENFSKKMASLRSYYCQLRSQYKSAKTKGGS